METEAVQDTPMNSEGKKRIRIRVFLTVILVSLTAFLALFFYTRDSGVILSKITVAGVDLTGLTQEEATRQIQEKLLANLSKELEFQIPDEEQTVKFQLKELGLNYPVDEALAQAWRLGREGNLFTKATHRFKARSGYDIPLSAQWDLENLEKTLKESLQPYNRSPEDASFQITSDNQMLIVPEKIGRELDFSTLASEISKLNIEQDPLHSITVPLLNEAAQPKITAAQLSAEKITGLLAQYSTQFDASLVNRTENIRLAARALDGKLLAPGERFSFNESVGERTAEAGYKEAMIIEGNIFTPGLGGGVCQVSSNLYNAVTLAQLEILERHPHSLPVTYVPPGQDATVAYPQLDFKFMNNSEAYVLIRSSVVENTLTFQLYGNVKN